MPTRPSAATAMPRMSAPVIGSVLGTVVVVAPLLLPGPLLVEVLGEVWW
jgi:hypothetical protein